MSFFHRFTCADSKFMFCTFAKIELGFIKALTERTNPQLPLKAEADGRKLPSWSLPEIFYKIELVCIVSNQIDSSF